MTTTRGRERPAHPVPWAISTDHGRGPNFGRFKILDRDGVLVTIVRDEVLAVRIAGAINTTEMQTVGDDWLVKLVK